MDNVTISWQLGDYSSNNKNITFGGNVEGAFVGRLHYNLILATSPWLFNLNYQGVAYDGIRVPRNESFIYGSIDPLMTFLAIPKKDFQPLKSLWKQIPGISCSPYPSLGLAD